MSRTTPKYGRRGRLDAAKTGIRQTASTYGKAKIGTFSDKAGGHIIVESDAERFVAHLLALDPYVAAFAPQPFTVDLIDQRLLLTREDVKAAHQQHQDVPGPKFYTPDFRIDWQDGLRHVVEVKAEGYEGDAIYWDKVARAAEILRANGYPLSTILFPANGTHPLRMNVVMLKQAGHRLAEHLTDDLVERVSRRCESEPVTVSTLCADLQISPSVIPLLLVSGVVSGDLRHHVVRGNFLLSAAYGDLSHLHLLEVRAC